VVEAKLETGIAQDRSLSPGWRHRCTSSISPAGLSTGWRDITTVI